MNSTRKALPFRSPLIYLGTLGPALKCFRNASACEPTDATAFFSSSSDTPKAFAQYCRSQGSLRLTLLPSGGPFLERSSPIQTSYSVLLPASRNHPVRTRRFIGGSQKDQVL